MDRHPPLVEESETIRSQFASENPNENDDVEDNRMTELIEASTVVGLSEEAGVTNTTIVRVTASTAAMMNSTSPRTPTPSVFHSDLLSLIKISRNK